MRYKCKEFGHININCVKQDETFQDEMNDIDFAAISDEDERTEGLNRRTDETPKHDDVTENPTDFQPIRHENKEAKNSEGVVISSAISALTDKTVNRNDGTTDINTKISAKIQSAKKLLIKYQKRVRSPSNAECNKSLKFDDNITNELSTNCFKFRK